jgi:iron complex transport system permease protein
MILLVGMVSAAFFSALVSVVKYFADVDGQLPALTFWLLGGLAGVSPGSVAVASVLIITSLVILFYKRWVLNLISFEDEESLSMGINLRRERGLIIILSTLMCSASVSLCGPVGWVGLLIPHAARMFWGSNYRALLPAVALLGGLYLMVMDGIARNAAMVEIPLGAITAIIGAPLFIFLLFRGNYFRD